MFTSPLWKIYLIVSIEDPFDQDDWEHCLVNLLIKLVWGVMGSHNNGETEEDTFIADLYVGLPTGQIKTGSMQLHLAAYFPFSHKEYSSLIVSLTTMLFLTARYLF
ncbi:hypothetical protein IFM89_034947 [Coptis chinensis]|uniref:phosphopyruvate hydratase n=1 Tax=Coptis chinensis TaxID=261450 RepID=A0A835I7D8_9MAGN|nr:hypothetical protein IFM89_034947 [Coptis chinensis]